MPSGTQSPQPSAPGSVRQRASKACQRCSQRKVKCDASRGFNPCSGCRMDGVEHCILTRSQRGTYDRSKRRLEASLSRSTAPSSSRGQEDLPPAACSSIQTSDTSVDTSEPSTIQLSSHSTSLSQVDTDSSSLSADQTLISSTRWVPNAAPQAVCSVVPNHGNATQSQLSLASMFENFLERENGDSDRPTPKVGLMFFGESSPLTFALEELNRGSRAHLHDAGNGFSSSQDLPTQPRGSHPQHCAEEDLVYLKAKGAFEKPDEELLEQLVAAFIDRFYPLYSIVDRDELLEAHRTGQTPWILLHAICFIGATFCEESVIYRSWHKSRFHARRLFYDKAKILFDVGYETNKFVLLQTVIMLTFWGPQMKSYWNPCSWIGFGVTIAGSLGIHRSTSGAHTGKDMGLTRRLWWALAVRDAYCATLLGRPFRIRMAQCDTEMLNQKDFPGGDESANQALYQIHVAKLSLILRSITQRLFNPDQHNGDVNDLCGLLDDWQAQTPAAIRDSTGFNNVFATALKLLYHHHDILIHLGQMSNGSQQPGRSATYPDALTIARANSSAQTISSTAAMLVTKRMTQQLPHEAFAGFFFAGIIFYRQGQQQPDSLIVQMARASLDNYQLLLNEVRDSWDPAFWMLRIFDFLQSTSASDPETGGKLPQQNTNDPAANLASEAYNIPAGSYIDNACGIDDSGFLYPVDWGSPTQDFTGLFNNFPLMGNYFMPPVDRVSMQKSFNEKS